MKRATMQTVELDSKTIGRPVTMTVVLPPGFDPHGAALPLFIELHGGGEDHTWLDDSQPFIEEMFADGTLCPAILVTFSSGPFSWYGGAWPEFVVEELPAWMAKKYHTRTDPAGVVMTGVSMGGYGTLKIGLRHPDRFAGIAAMEPAIEPSFEWMPPQRRNTWYRVSEADELVWGAPLDRGKWLADNPAHIARTNAQAIRASGLALYLECGDRDHLNLHDGTEFLHRVLWDHEIRHEYHLVRWADHVGVSLLRRIREAHAFLTSSLAGGREEPTDLPLTEREREFVDAMTRGVFAGDARPDFTVLRNLERAPSIHAALSKARRETAAGDPEMKRSYARLPPTS